MTDAMHFKVSCSACDLWGSVIASGDDCTIIINGGSSPHVGCVCLAIPRPSLTGEGISATVSVINRTGHMDDLVASDVAKQVARARNCVVACSCGIHIDHATQKDVQHIQHASVHVAEAIIGLLSA